MNTNEYIKFCDFSRTAVKWAEVLVGYLSSGKGLYWALEWFGYLWIEPG